MRYIIFLKESSPSEIAIGNVDDVLIDDSEISFVDPKGNLLCVLNKGSYNAILIDDGKGKEYDSFGFPKEEMTTMI